MTQPEFDRYSASYEELLHDPLRERFVKENSQFFHVRKRDLIREFFRRRQIDTHNLKFLDVGCGKGELMSMLGDDFAQVSGCDPSGGMLEGASNADIRLQTDPLKLPFD